MDIYEAFTGPAAAKQFVKGLPDGMNGKFDGDILIPVIINTKQLTSFAEHYRKFLQKNQEDLYLTLMFQHGSDAADGPYKYIVTSLWAIKKDVATFKKLGVPFPMILSWYNSEEEIALLKKHVTLKEFDKKDITKYIHYANVYLTEDKAYCLHYKGQR